VTFPKGTWIDWQTGMSVTGPTRVEVDAPLDTLPIFARGRDRAAGSGDAVRVSWRRNWSRCAAFSARSLARVTGALRDAAGPDYQRGVALDPFRGGERRWLSLEDDPARQAEGQFDPGPRDYTIEISVPRLTPASRRRP
jgi:hypothetical protein